MRDLTGGTSAAQFAVQQPGPVGVDPNTLRQRLESIYQSTVRCNNLVENLIGAFIGATTGGQNDKVVASPTVAVDTNVNAIAAKLYDLEDKLAKIVSAI